MQKALTSGVQNARRKVTLKLRLSSNEVLINAKAAMNNAFRIAVTEAIPNMHGSGQPADVRRRSSNKIKVTGVNIRLSLSVSDETRVMIFPYEPHESVRQDYLSRVPLRTVPDAHVGEVPESMDTVMVNHHNLGLVSKHSPLMTRKAGDNVDLDSVDGTPFECRVATHAGKPIGSVFRKSFGGGNLRRNLNWDQSASSKLGMGYTAWSNHLINHYWKVAKVYEYPYECMNQVAFDRAMEMVMIVDCPSLEVQDIPETTSLVGAVIKAAVVDVYYHDI